MRAPLFGLGLLALAAAWLSPLPGIARHAFWAHMTMHMVVVAVAAPLLALGVAGGRFDPVPRAPALFAPVPASMLELVVVWAWHAPQLHHSARGGAAGLVVEQVIFLTTGLLLWLSACGGDPEDRSRRAAGVIGLLITSMHMTLLGALLALSPRPLYHHHTHGPSALSPLEDQHLGGAVMLIIGGVAYLAGGLGLTAGLTRSPVVRAGMEAR